MKISGAEDRKERRNEKSTVVLQRVVCGYPWRGCVDGLDQSDDIP